MNDPEMAPDPCDCAGPNDKTDCENCRRKAKEVYQPEYQEVSK